MSSAQKFSLGSTNTVAVLATVLTAAAAAVGVMMWSKAQTMPSSPVKEGFGGVAVGSGMPECLRASSEGAAIAGFFTGRTVTAEEGEDDLRELLLLLSKLGCFKKDLMGVAGVVEATRYQPYSTAHDIEPVAETTARCFAKTIPPRDLDISLEKWEGRGSTLLRRLCTAYDVSSTDNAMLKNKFKAMIADVKDVAKSVCFVGIPIIEGKKQGRVTQGYEPPSLVDLGEYKGRY
jgi:hypothetical protein